MEDLTPFPLIPTSTGQFKTSLVYRASVRAARTMKRNLKKTKPKKKKKKAFFSSTYILQERIYYGRYNVSRIL